MDVLVSKSSTPSTRDSFLEPNLDLVNLNDKEVEIPVSANTNLNLPTMDIPGMPGSQMGMINLGDVFGKGFGGQKNEEDVSERFSFLFIK